MSIRDYAVIQILLKKSASQGMFFYRIPYFLFGENIYANRKLTWY